LLVLDAKLSSPSNAHTFKRGRLAVKRSLGRNTGILAASSQYVLLVFACGHMWAF